jgi:hypothetical protein
VGNVVPFGTGVAVNPIVSEAGQDRFWRASFVPSSASLVLAYEVSSDNGSGCILDRLISSVIALAEDGRVSIVRFSAIELCKGGLSAARGVPTALEPSSFLTVVATRTYWSPFFTKSVATPPGLLVLGHQSFTRNYQGS